jgi:hypothetical protein
MSIKVILTCLAILSPFLILAGVIIFSPKPPGAGEPPADPPA